MKAWDRLRLEVAIVENGNVYSWVGASRFEGDEALEKLAGRGPLGTGDFGLFLDEIFRSALLTFRGDEIVDGRPFLKFSYDVPIGRSGYKINIHEGWVRTAYSGTFRLDADSTDIASLTVRTAELPPASNACQAISEVDYGRALIHDRMILVPRETRLHAINPDGTQTRSVSTYANCREYASKSRMLFQAPPSGAEAGGEASAGAPPNPLPEGVHLDTRIVTPIDSDTAWAGDAIEAVLRSPLRDKKHKIAAPAGARLHGRLVRFGHISEPVEHFEIAVQLESIEINGQTVPLRAALYYGSKVMTEIIISRSPSSTARDDRAAGIGTFDFRVEHLRLKQLDSEWITLAPSNEADTGGETH